MNRRFEIVLGVELQRLLPDVPSTLKEIVYIPIKISLPLRKIHQIERTRLIAFPEEVAIPFLKYGDELQIRKVTSDTSSKLARLLPNLSKKSAGYIVRFKDLEISFFTPSLSAIRVSIHCPGGVITPVYTGNINGPNGGNYTYTSILDL